MKKIYISILTILALFTASCNKKTDIPEDVDEGKAKVQIKIAGTTYKQDLDGDAELHLHASTKTKGGASAPMPQSIEIPFNGDYGIRATLISEDPEILPLPEGTKYVVSVYDDKGTHVDHKEYTHGSGNNPQEFTLDPGTYTFIAVSSGSNSLPDIDYNANLSTINFEGVDADVDLMYQKLPVEASSGNNDVTFLMEHLFTQVVVTLNSVAHFGDILSINGGTVSPHQPAAALSLANGAVTLSGTVGEKEFTFPNDASGLSWTSDPVMILNTTTETGTVVLEGVTINETTQDLTFENLNIKTGVKYVLKIDLDPEDDATVKDIDGNVYHTVVIDDLEWMVENLKVTRYNNGDTIETGFSNEVWKDLTTGAYAIYPYGQTSGVIASEEEMIAGYGLLYNGYAVLDERGLAPDGWRVATDEDFKALERTAGISESDIETTGLRGTVAGKLISTTVSGATDDFGFSAVPAGIRDRSDGAFKAFNDYNGFRIWTSTSTSATLAYVRVLQSTTGAINRSTQRVELGFSVRCVRDKQSQLKRHE